MKKKFKKIYVEITNKCNLNCSFCSNTERNFKDMGIDEFKIVISKIKNFTDYIYLHVKGEPLLHPELDKILDICDKEKIHVNITTNGTLLKDRLTILSSHKCVRQLNVSLHSENKIDNYFQSVFSSCKILSTKMFISYRIWNLNDNKLNKISTNIVEKIKKYYNLSDEVVEKIKNEQNIKIYDNTFVNKNNLFEWPNVNNNFNIDTMCYGLSSHIGILSDGTIVPCCLDGNGDISLGNIFEDSLQEVLDSEKVKDMIEGFKNNKSINRLCKNCNFRYRFTKKK